MPAFRIYLVRSETIIPRHMLYQAIREALSPLSEQAGKELVLVPMVQESVNLDGPQIVFDWHSHHIRMGEQFIRHRPPMLAGESGVVFVNVLLELRTGGPPVYPSYRAGRVDYMTPTEPLFRNGEPLFARAAGNVTVHEIAHMLGIQSHSSYPSNFMATGFDTGVIGLSNRRENLRSFWGGSKSFNREQRRVLIEAIRTGSFGGDPLIERR